jgi:predicted metal-dependent HD superfamily phosphohydrolase
VKKKLLSQLIEMKNPKAVWDEVHLIIDSILIKFDWQLADKAFDDLQKLYSGNFPGYRACNTEYHDIHHITDVTLASVRIIHSLVLDKHIFTPDDTLNALLGALFHDTGYIQETDDTEGTGAKYTLTHVSRSCEWAGRYLTKRGFSQERVAAVQSVIWATDHNIPWNSIKFTSSDHELLAKAVGTGDLVGQMADRVYLEKLQLLFEEFKEAEIPGFFDKVSLYKKTQDFATTIFGRLDTVLSQLYMKLPLHFNERWKIPSNLYWESIQRQLQYLQERVLADTENLDNYLRRSDELKKR